MKRKEILQTVEGIICRDRNTQHGEPEDVFGTIAEFWTTYLQGRAKAGATTIKGHDVAAMMNLFKMARHASNPSNLDNAIDGAGYAAILGELQPDS